AKLRGNRAMPAVTITPGVSLARGGPARRRSAGGSLHGAGLHRARSRWSPREMPQRWRPARSSAAGGSFLRLLCWRLGADHPRPGARIGQWVRHDEAGDEALVRLGAVGVRIHNEDDDLLLIQGAIPDRSTTPLRQLHQLGEGDPLDYFGNAAAILG